MDAYVPNDWPIMVAYVDDQGRPGMSFRGSVVDVSETQLGFWARNGEGGTAKAIGNCHVPGQRTHRQQPGRT
jgi:hypothetical protein